MPSSDSTAQHAGPRKLAGCSGPPAPSPWVTRWTPLIAAGAGVLDVACGSGRHVRWLAARGHHVTAIDRDAQALAGLADLGTAVQAIRADIEGAPWPLPDGQFGAVVVTNYLWRPLLPTLLSSVAAGGVLLYETFAAGNQTVGKPARPDFLLQPGELLRWCGGSEWRVVAYEDGFARQPDRFIQRIAAVRAVARADTPVAAAQLTVERYPLD